MLRLNRHDIFKKKDFRAVFTWGSRYNDIDYDSLGINGCNTIIMSDGWLLRNPETLYTNTENFLNKLQGYNIDLHLMFPAFTNANNQNTDPVSQIHRENISNALFNLLDEFSGLKGVQTDDYVYNDPYYDFQQEATQQIVLRDFAREMATAVHDANSEAQFSLNLLKTDHRAAKISLLAPECDFIQAEIYRLSGGMDMPSQIPLTSLEGHRWVRDTLRGFMRKSGDTPVVVDLITYQDNATHTPRTDGDIERDILKALKENIIGYALFSEAYTDLSTVNFYDSQKAICF